MFHPQIPKVLSMLFKPGGVDPHIWALSGLGVWSPAQTHVQSVAISDLALSGCIRSSPGSNPWMSGHWPRENCNCYALFFKKERLYGVKIGGKRCWIMAWEEKKKDGFRGISTTAEKKVRAPYSPHWVNIDKVCFVSRESLPR